MTIMVEFETEQEAQRVLYLLHQDLARVEGSIVLAHQTLSIPVGNTDYPGGGKRQRAGQTLQSAPKQASILRAAQKAVRAGLEAARP